MRRFASAVAACAATAAGVGVGLALHSSPAGAGALPGLAREPAFSSLAKDRIYFVMTDRYANGDLSNDTGGIAGTRSQNGFDPSSTAYWHGGDFKGLTGGCTDPVRGLQRVRDLGFNAIWITPPVVNQVSQGDSAGYHGYWGLDFTRVDPHLGTDRDFGSFVSCAHRLGMKVIMDVVVNHTGDVVLLNGGTAYDGSPYRDCHGKVFRPSEYVGTSTFPCLSARFMPHTPFVLPQLASAKKPEWLNDPLEYHDRGDIDWSSCSEQCFQQGDFFGLDDLFTEKPHVERGLAQIYADWVTKYKLDGFRVDTARHVNPGFFKLWVPQSLAAARTAGVPDFQIFGEVAIGDSVELSGYVRDWKLPSVLDFPFQDAVAGYASGGSSAIAISNRMEDDDYFRGPDGIDPTPPTFLGNHDMGRAALQISQHGGGLVGDALLRRTLLGYDVLYLLRGAPVVYYGDEVGMMGSGGDQQARQDMFPTQVSEWRTQPRVGSPPIGTASSFDVRTNPIELRLRELGRLRDTVPELASGSTVVRDAHKGVLAVSRVGLASRREVVAVFNAGDRPAVVSVQTSTPLTAWTALLGSVPTSSGAGGRLRVTVPALSTVLLAARKQLPLRPAVRPVVRVQPDLLTSFWQISAKVASADPVSVTFAVRRAGSGSWQPLSTDDSPPYRAFLDPAGFSRHEKVELAAVVRASDGSVASSAPIPFEVRST